MEERNFDFLITKNEAGQHVAIVNGEEFTPYLVVDGKRYAIDDLLALIPANDAALDWADANARAFPIETAPRDEWIDVWCSESKMWYPVFMFPSYVIRKTATHWRPLPPPPSNPPLPEPLERLGEVLRRVKNV